MLAPSTSVQRCISLGEVIIWDERSAMVTRDDIMYDYYLLIYTQACTRTYVVPSLSDMVFNLYQGAISLSDIESICLRSYRIVA